MFVNKDENCGKKIERKKNIRFSKTNVKGA